MYYFLLRWIPKNALSRMLGAAASRAWPSWLLRMVIRAYCSIYGIDMTGFAVPPEGFRTFNEFFTRPLREGARPIDPDAGVAVSPVDGRISQAGEINGGRLIQAKGKDYSLAELLGEDPVWQAFEGGTFATLYLSPRDYHRIHSPVAGRVTRFLYLPGELWSVSPAGVRNVPRLFSRNERLVTVLDTDFGEVILVAVGATVVGKIRVVYHEIASNLKGARPLAQALSPPFPLEKGQELARFELGSTVILLFRPGQAVLENLRPGDAVQMGQGIATLHRSN